MSNVDWQKIKAEYLQGGTSYRKLAEKYEVPFSTLEKKARAEKWTKLRESVSEEAETIVRQKLVSQRAKDISSLERSRSMLIAKLENSISKFPDIPGNRMEQAITEIITPDDKNNDSPKKKLPKQKTVRFESDLLKMVTTLGKLMEMIGYSGADEESADDGFLEALNAQAVEVTEDDSDIPEDL